MNAACLDWALVMRNAPIALAIIAPSGEALEVNPALTELMGYTREELLGRAFESISHPDHLELDRSYIRAMLAGELERYDSERRCIHKDGRIVWVDLHVTLARRADGTPSCFIAQIVDVERRREIEAWLWESRVALAALEIDRKRIEQRLSDAQKHEAISQLTGGIVHDLNNLLAATMLQLDELLIQPALADRTRESIREIRATADLGANLMRQALRSSREQHLALCSIDLNDSVIGLTKLLRRLLPDDIRIDVQLASTSTRANADPAMIDQVIMNLVVNARDAMPGGGTVTIATGVTELGPETASALQLEPGRYVTLRCIDSGCGIEAANLTRIFDRFFTTKAPDQGTGIGLSTVLGIVKRHRGAIEVTSSIGHGSTFEVFLPATETSTDRPSSDAPGTPAPAGDETILLVEDDLELRGVLRKLLGQHGYRVIEASTTAEAVSVWDTAAPKPDLLLADLSVSSGTGGRELAKELRARAPELKVILTSGYSADFVTVAKLSFGQYFLAKPCAPSLLLETVRWCLDGRL